MKTRKTRFKNFLTQSFERFQRAPVPEAQSAWKQLLDRHRDGDAGVFESMDVAERDAPVSPVGIVRNHIWAAAGVMLVIAVGLWVTLLPSTAAATVASVEGGLHRITGTETQSLKVNDPIRAGELIRSNGGSGGSLVLADGAHIEMRSGSELRLEKADDGVRIELNNGGIIVNAARQREGHLHVQTRDFIVSVVGTVSMVNAEAEGSRVAVIEGEVQVEQGRIETKLRSGEQVVSNPSMEQLPVSQEIAWSRQAEAHLATLQQKLDQIVTEMASIVVASQGARPAADKWESISIQACGSRNTQAGVRGGAVGSSPGELRVTCMPLRYLLEMAYVKWLEPDAIRPRWFYPISGGPSWVDTELWTIRARANGQQDHQTLGGPMLQTLLEDRFKLKMQREVIEEQVYELLDVGFKPQPLKEGECAAREAKKHAALSGITDLEERLRAALLTPGMFPCGAQAIGAPSDGSPAPPGTRTVNVHGGSLDLLIRNLSLDRIVLDRTGIKGIFDMRLTYSVVTSPMREPKPLPPGVVPGGDSIFTAMEQQLGLRLLPVKGPRIYYTIQQVERPVN
ncbi:MAG TPA: TIGR03435 family protein [Terriglobia bacterium]|nr:TIGR03435 family protein [Terriglobia bacterium]